MYLSDEMPTVEDSREQEQEARDFGADLELFDENIISTTLPVNAQTCYELFCDVARIPEWVTTVRSVQVLAFDDEGRPARAAFLASLGRASAGIARAGDPRGRGAPSRLVPIAGPPATTRGAAGSRWRLPTRRARATRAARRP